MPNPNENRVEKEKKYLASIASSAYEQVWRNFSEDLRPDPTKIPNAYNIVVAPLLSGGDLMLHPRMKPEIRRLNEQVIADTNRTAAQDKTSWYYRGEYRFAPSLLMLPEQFIKRVVYYQIGSMLVLDSPPILPSEYSLEKRVYVQEMLDAVLEDGHGVSVDDTQIAREGFRRRLCVGKFTVGDMFISEKFFPLDQMFPLAYEIITAEIVKHGGNVEAFDYDIQNDTLLPDMYVNNPRYYSALAFVFRHVDWRILLSALRKSDGDEIMNTLEPHLEGRTERALSILLRAVEEDENILHDVFTRFYGPKNN